MGMMQTTYQPQELAALLGVSRQAVSKRAGEEHWDYTPRPGKGGGKLWVVSSMPAETRDMLASALLRQVRGEQREEKALDSRLRGNDGEKRSGNDGEILRGNDGKGVCGAIPTQSAPASSLPCLIPALTQHNVKAPALPVGVRPSVEFARASQRERGVALARLAFVREIERLYALVGKEGAIKHLVEASRLGRLSPALARLVPEAVACKRDGVLSRRSLYRWCGDFAAGGEAALLPSYRKEDPVPAWAEDFLRHYQKPQHPMLTNAYSDFRMDYAQRGLAVPSIYAVRRLIAKMSKPEREAGRATGNALLKLRPYKRRDTSELWPTDVYTADGTTFDAEVLHPYQRDAKVRHLRYYSLHRGSTWHWENTSSRRANFS